MVLDYLCCEPVIYDDKSQVEDDSITCSTDEGILECDYDTEVTKLYHSIEERQWEEVLYFLETGKWYNTSIFSAFGEAGESASVQARTWVTALDEDGNVRWCQLPLHAAVTFLAPFAIIAKLIEMYPKSVRCADDQDMLPLHYAFRFGAEDDVVVHLLQSFPQAVGKKAVKDRLPLDLAQYGPRPERGKLIDCYMQSAVRNAKIAWDREYEKIVEGMKNESDKTMAKHMNKKTEELDATKVELAKARRQIEDLKLEISLERRESPESSGFGNIISVKKSRSFRSQKSSTPTGSPSRGGGTTSATVSTVKDKKQKNGSVNGTNRPKRAHTESPQRTSRNGTHEKRSFHLFGKRK